MQAPKKRLPAPRSTSPHEGPLMTKCALTPITLTPITAYPEIATIARFRQISRNFGKNVR